MLLADGAEPADGGFCELAKGDCVPLLLWKLCGVPGSFGWGVGGLLSLESAGAAIVL